MLLLAFDTATEVATVALADGDTILGERQTSAGRLLAEIELLVSEAGIRRENIEGIAVGIGPGRYTSLRMGLVTARTLSFVLGIPVAGVSTLEALAAGAPGALPVVDARRREVFTVVAEQPACLVPGALGIDPGRLCVGDGAVRYRDVLEAAGAVVPPDDDARHVPHARHHARLARAFGPGEAVEPVYLRAPDADRALARQRESG
jgi:tRNA threonylcarbamoyladenosine biosynthesis protein TsaB